jgi:predicted small lipoprotein YifL
MLRWIGAIVWVMLLAACGQKGPLVLPEDARRKQSPTPAHNVPPAQERTQ